MFVLEKEETMSHENSVETGNLGHVCHPGTHGYCDCSDISSAVMEKLRKELSEVGFPGTTIEEIRRFIPSSLICETCSHLGILTSDARDGTDLAVCPQCGRVTFIGQSTPPGTRV